ncbi:MAG TPA: methionyl-tRNA formyltransferase [Halioglobus sp.]
MSNNSLRVIFAGTPAFAATHLESLIKSEHQLLAVYTQPDRPAGRGRKLQASPVKILAEQVGLNVYQPASLKDKEVQQQLADLGADVMVVVAYGLILPQAVLDTPRFGCLNVHASLLPRWRGAAPIQRAIEAGDATTGITIMQMNAGLDTGAMLASVNCPIGSRTNAASLHEELALLGPPLLQQVLGDIEHRRSLGETQDDRRASYAHKILKAEAQIDWCHSAQELDRKVRAFNPFPVCYSCLNGERVRFWQARPLNSEVSLEPPGTIVRAGEEGLVVSCGNGALAIEVLQLEGGKALSAQQLLSAHRALFAPGSRFALLTAVEH